MKIGLLREGKIPPDKRVVFSPKQCKEILKLYHDVSIFIQPSEVRCFTDLEYKKNGVLVQEDLSNCDVIMGVKEVPVEMLIENKMFFFFSHTIKKQPYNRELLKTIIDKKIQLVDYETLVYENGKRVLGFGRYAGIVGAYNTFLAYGKKSTKYSLKPAHLLEDEKDLYFELSKVDLPSNFKILLTGNGRVSKGALEVIKFLQIQKISKSDFIDKGFNTPTYTQLSSEDYNVRIDNESFSKEDFYKNPTGYKSCLMDYLLHANILITGHYYSPGSPVLLSSEDLQNKSLKLEAIGDISCDIAGPIASTIRPSTIADPVYGYNRFLCVEDDYTKKDVLVVMAVDNLPCSLPKDASVDFGTVFIKEVLPDLLTQKSLISRATITQNGTLTENFSYLQDYIS